MVKKSKIPIISELTPQGLLVVGFIAVLAVIVIVLGVLAFLYLR